MESPKRESASARWTPQREHAATVRRLRKARCAAVTHRRGSFSKRPRAGSMGHLTMYRTTYGKVGFITHKPQGPCHHGISWVPSWSLSCASSNRRVRCERGRDSHPHPRMPCVARRRFHRLPGHNPSVKMWDRHFLHSGTFHAGRRAGNGRGNREGWVLPTQYVCGMNSCSDMAGRTYVESTWRRGILSFLGV